MTYVCKLCNEEKDASSFPKEKGKIRRYVCWQCRGRRERAQQKLRLLEAFGFKCQCCGESNPYFLTLDHKVPGQGERSTRLKAHQLYARAAAEGWPKDKYQVLCMNCNFAKGHFGECPHSLGITAEMALAELRQKASLVVESSFTTGLVTEAQRQALDSGRHLGPKVRWEGHVKTKGVDDVFAELGVTKEQLLEALQKTGVCL
jgi:hypothetical protein